MYWFTADWHLYHDNVIELASRPFRTPHKMMNCYIKKYKERIMPDDTCYFISDFFWGCSIHNLELVLNKLPGKKILILGNHDLIKPFDYVEAGFHRVSTHEHFITYDRGALYQKP
jgi:calcineurin-like phosphoesterase family protein